MIYLYISTFGEKVRIKNRKFIPIEVGAAGRTNYHYEMHDNTGNNISDQNSFFGELTGLYWAWKNGQYSNADLVGFGHYNKILDISEQEVEEILSGGVDWIARTPTKIVPHSYPDDIRVLRGVLGEINPLALESWDALYERNGASRSENCSNCETFYAGAKEFDAYCSFLFDVLFRVKERIGEVDRPPYHKRYLAFLGERLLSVYLRLYHKKAVYRPLLPLNESVWKRVMHTVIPANTMKKIKENRLYQQWKEKQPRKSSYSRK